MDPEYQDLPLSYWESLIKEIDKNGDGTVINLFIYKQIFIKYQSKLLFVYFLFTIIYPIINYR